MASAPKLGPLMLLRAGLYKLEGGANAFLASKARNEQFSQLLGQWIKVSVGVQHVAGKVLAGLYARLDVPSRTELAALAAAVQRIEDKMSALAPATPSLAPRPSRTRRAPQPVAAVEPQAAVSPQPAPVKQRATRNTNAKTAVKAERGARPSRTREVRP